MIPKIQKCNFQHSAMFMYDDTTDFEICEFHKKHKNVDISRTNKKID